MMPNMDPKYIKSMMSKLGIKSSEIDSNRVIIEGKEKDIIIENPQVTYIEGQGMMSFQITGDVKEVEKGKIEISDDDVKMVEEQTHVNDEKLVRKTLEETNGNIAEAIIKLKEMKK